MSELRTFSCGQSIGSQDEVSTEMYIMLKGAVEARVNTNGAGDSQVVGLLRRGDVFGEIGLILSQRQPLDFVATEDVEVIAINELFLRRIKWRYPRIAAQIFFNLTTIVTDRLEWLLRVTNELDQSRPISRPVWQTSPE
jgi:CRP-like cAMP-binding protein